MDLSIIRRLFPAEPDLTYAYSLCWTLRMRSVFRPRVFHGPNVPAVWRVDRGPLSRLRLIIPEWPSRRNMI